MIPCPALIDDAPLKAMLRRHRAREAYNSALGHSVSIYFGTLPRLTLNRFNMRRVRLAAARISRDRVRFAAEGVAL